VVGLIEGEEREEEGEEGDREGIEESGGRIVGFGRVGVGSDYFLLKSWYNWSHNHNGYNVIHNQKRQKQNNLRQRRR